MSKRSRKKIDDGKLFFAVITCGLSIPFIGIYEDPKPRKKKVDEGKVALGVLTCGLSLFKTGIYEDPKPRKSRKKKKGMSYIDDRWCDRASWF